MSRISVAWAAARTDFPKVRRIPFVQTHDQAKGLPCGSLTGSNGTKFPAMSEGHVEIIKAIKLTDVKFTM